MTSSILAAEPAPEYLSDPSSERIAASSQGWGVLGLDTAAKPLHQDAMKLRIKNKTYRRGLGHHATGEIIVALDGQYKTFECEVGVQWQGGKTTASVVFQVYADGKKLFDSGVMHENDPAKPVSVSVAGAEELRLVANDAGDGITYDCADWAEARLTADPAAKATAEQTAVDLAPFARVVTSDPKRINGTAASRVQEMPAADVFMETDLKPAADGSFAVPIKADAPSCIGLRWYEKRTLRRVELRFADGAAMPSPDAIQLQYWADITPVPHWTGSSPWQGQWKPLPAKFEQSDGVWRWQITGKEQSSGTYRVRWVFPASKQPIAIKEIAAFSRSKWYSVELRAELQKPEAGRSTSIGVYNGVLLSPSGDLAGTMQDWNAGQPATLKVRYSKPRIQKADRTVLQFRLPRQTISVAVEDVPGQQLRLCSKRWPVRDHQSGEGRIVAVPSANCWKEDRSGTGASAARPRLRAGDGQDT